MANQDIQMRYRRSVIGPFWISIALAVLIFSIGLLYSQVQHQPFKEFLTFFGCGLLAWTFLMQMISEGCTLVVDSESYLRSVNLPLPVLAARMVFRNFIILLHNAVVIGLMLAIFGQSPGPTAWLAPLALLLYIPIGWFFAIAFGPICARFRDLPQVISSGMQVLFFLTPIFWVPGGSMDRHAVLTVNPFYHLISIVREPLLGRMPTELNWIVSFGVLGTLGVLALLTTAFARKRVFLWL